MPPRRKQPADLPVLSNGLNEEIIEAFEEHLRKGYPERTVCDLLMVTVSQYRRWRSRGEALIEQAETEADLSRLTPRQRRYVRFYLVTTKATAEHHARLVKRLLDRTNADWRRELAILERRDRGNWGRGDGIVIFDEGAVSDEAYL